MRLAQLNIEQDTIYKIYEPDECELYSWSDVSSPVFAPEVVMIDITELSPDISEGWSYADGEFIAPPPPPPPTMSEVRAAKIAEIRDTALRLGQAGTNIIGSIEPLMTYHMAITPDDVNLLKQANEVAKLEASLVGTTDITAEIKEKWIEEGEERTRLHPSVPIAVHDSVLAQAILQAKEIYRRQEELIQQVQDAETVEAVQGISWI